MNMDNMAASDKREILRKFSENMGYCGACGEYRKLSGGVCSRCDSASKVQTSETKSGSRRSFGVKWFVTFLTMVIVGAFGAIALSRYGWILGVTGFVVGAAIDFVLLKRTGSDVGCGTFIVMIVFGIFGAMTSMQHYSGGWYGVLGFVAGAVAGYLLLKRTAVLLITGSIIGIIVLGPFKLDSLRTIQTKAATPDTLSTAPASGGGK